MSVTHAQPPDRGGMRGQTAALACALAGGQLGLHTWFAVSAGDPRMLMPHVVAWALDVFVLLITTAFLLGIGAALRRFGFRKVLPVWGVNGLIFLVGVSLAGYPGLLTEFLAFPTSIFRADGASAWFFITEYLGWSGLWPLLVPAAMAVVASRVTWRPSRPRTGLVVVAPVMLLAVAAWLRPAPHPLVYSVQDLMKGWLTGNQRVVPSLARPSGRLPLTEGVAVEPLRLDDQQTLRYDHVLMLVLEGVTTSRFEREFLSRSQGYCASLRDRSAYFDGYHTTNLDSYTSLVAMLTSVQVPYRAYADPRSYEAVNQAPNLVATLRSCGFHSLYISTAEHHPFIPVRASWDRIMLLGDLPQRQGWVAVSGSKVEAGLEDRAAVPAILDFVSAHPKTLVMHELLFGHSPKWMARTGRSQAEYDDAYLREILRGLEQKELLDRTLLVVVSDHGDRAESANVANYRVPLLISGCGIPPSRTPALYSHLDFQQIVAHFLAGRPLPVGRESLLTVGSTERWMYGEITASGAYLFIDNDTGAPVASHGALKAQAVFDRFQNQLREFALRHQR